MYINKSVSIVGNGYDSHIVSTIGYNLNGQKSLSFEGLRINQISLIGNFPRLSSITVRTCKIEHLMIVGCDSVNVDRCYIDRYDNYYGGFGQIAGYYSKNVNIKNSKIKEFLGRNIELVDNCNIREISNVANLPYCLSSSIVNSADLGAGSHLIMQNCLIGKGSNTSESQLNMKNCYRLDEDADVLDENLECTLDLVQNGYLGTDGTQVGIYGGEWLPFTETPTLPTVDESASSVIYDAENKQLKVNIKIME